MTYLREGLGRSNLPMVWPFTDYYVERRLNEISLSLARIERALNTSGGSRALEELKAMASRNQELLNQIVTEQTEQTNAVTAVEGTIDRLIALVEESKDDPEELTAILERVKANRTRLVAAALKGTPADPVPSDPVPPPPEEPTDTGGEGGEPGGDQPQAARRNKRR